MSKIPKEKVDELISQMYDISTHLHDIVWEPQEGQKDHFDSIPKVERVAIIGLLDDAIKFRESLSQYKHWFSDNNTTNK